MPGRLSFLLLSSSVRSMYSRTRVRTSLSKISRSNVAILEPQLGHVNSWSSRCVCMHSSQNDVLQQGVLTASRMSFVHSGQAREESLGCRSRISDSVRPFERVFCFSQAALRIPEFVYCKMTKAETYVSGCAMTYPPSGVTITPCAKGAPSVGSTDLRKLRGIPVVRLIRFLSYSGSLFVGQS